MLAKLGAPGMCNPDDHHPCIDGDPSAEAVQRDTRSPGQRHHDALTAMGRAVLASGQLGQLGGLPATLIVTAALQDLQAAAGVGVTAGGTLLPMREQLSARLWTPIFKDRRITLEGALDPVGYWPFADTISGSRWPVAVGMRIVSRAWGSSR